MSTVTFFGAKIILLKVKNWEKNVWKEKQIQLIECTNLLLEVTNYELGNYDWRNVLSQCH